MQNAMIPRMIFKVIFKVDHRSKINVAEMFSSTNGFETRAHYVILLSTP